RTKQIVSFGALALIAPQSGEAHCGAQFPELGALQLRNRHRLMVAGLGTGAVAHRPQHVPSQPNRLGLIPSFLCLLGQAPRLDKVVERGLPLPGHPASVREKSETPWPPEYESELIPASQAGGEERNSLVRIPQYRQAPAAPDESPHPKKSQSMLGG